MGLISVYCKKGGVGKTTFLAYLAHYHANKGKKILIISADDQNSIFKVFGAENCVTAKSDDFFENLCVGAKEPSDVVFEVRPNMYLMKTLNTDKFSYQLKEDRTFEKKLQKLIISFNDYFDYIFVDYPPSSSRLSEILLDNSEKILVVVGLSALGIEGYKNTLQYFVDSDIDLSKISHVIPLKSHPVKIAPKQSLAELKKIAPKYTPNAILTEPVPDCVTLENLQAGGVSIFDEFEAKSRFHDGKVKKIREQLAEIYSSIKL